jgi:ATP-dependent DNA helicase PIF1
MRPVVRFADGQERPISSHSFSVSLGGRIVAQRSQIPLILAWGVSVHKSQGMSVDRAVIDIRNSFEYGQAYGTYQTTYHAFVY